MTVRSADDLLADLSACRSFRHLKAGKLERAATLGMVRDPAPYQKPKHTKLGLTCSSCGRLRSDFSEHSATARCSACYQNNSIKEWVFASDAFTNIVKANGYSCDTCDQVTEVPAERAEAAATRILENLDGYVRPVFCARCSKDFTAFCTREFQRDARAFRSYGHDKMVLAYVALQVSRAGWNVWEGRPAVGPRFFKGREGRHVPASL